jgi:hypothetical protein
MGKSVNAAIDMGGVSPSPLSMGTYLMGQSATDPANKPPLHSVDDVVWLILAEGVCYLGFAFSIGVEMEFFSALVGPACGHKFQMSGWFDTNYVGIGVSDQHIESGLAFGCNVGFPLFVVKAATNEYLSCDLDGDGWTLQLDVDESWDGIDLIPLMRLVAGLPGIKFNVQETDNIDDRLQKTWACLDPAHAGNTTKLPMSVYLDLVSVAITTLPPPVALLVKLVRGILSFLDYWFSTGPGLTYTLTTTVTPNAVLDPANTTNRRKLSGSGGYYDTTKGLDPTYPAQVALEMVFGVTSGFGMSWITSIGIHGIYSHTWQPTLDTTDLFEFVGGTDPQNPLTKNVTARTPSFGVGTSAPQVGAVYEPAFEVVFEPTAAAA